MKRVRSLFSPRRDRSQSSFGRGRIIELRQGIPGFVLGDLYHFLLTLSWIPFLALLGGGYLATNIVFAWLYGWDPNAIEGSDGFWDDFFFSIQTMSTIGYGGLTPESWYGNILVTIQSLVSLFGIATSTGLMFARISKPNARVMFSRVAVVAENNGLPTLMFRVANQRLNQIVEAQIRVTLICNEITAEGGVMRRFYDLKLFRTMTPIFALTWTVMHPIDADSLLAGATPASLERDQVELIITLLGTDDTFNQTVHARHSYLAHEIAWGYRFQDMMRDLPDGRRLLDYRYFHEIVPLQQSALAPSSRSEVSISPSGSP